MFTSFESDDFTGGEASVARAPATPAREPHTLPDVAWRRSREIARRMRALEDAWAMHANAANGFGAGETAA